MLAHNLLALADTLAQAAQDGVPMEPADLAALATLVADYASQAGALEAHLPDTVFRIAAGCELSLIPGRHQDGRED